jgi:four helix bundle protein
LSDQLEERLIEFAARIVTFSTELGGTPAGKHIAMQMLRSGTAPAPNYAEARGAESRADFIHRPGVVQKELNETGVWLRILLKTVAEKRETLWWFSRKTRNWPRKALANKCFIDQVDRGDICEILDAQITETFALLEGVSEEQSLRRYAPEKWSIRQVLNHISDTERAFAFRAWWFAPGFESPLPDFDQNSSTRSR